LCVSRMTLSYQSVSYKLKGKKWGKNPSSKLATKLE
jgi:hypothetical protein